jgi:uncharacterized protein
MIALGYFFAILVGFVLGLLGGGGSILTVPILAYMFEIPASVATTYSLFVVGTTSVVGTLRYLRLGQVDFRAGPLFLFPSLVGVWLARRILLPLVPELLFETAGFSLTKDRLVLLTFAGVMGLASYSMLQRRKTQPRQKATTVESKTFSIPLYGLMAGGLMGFVGAGGGFLIIPVLVGVANLEMKHAIGTSLFIITVSSLFGFVGDLLKNPVVDWKFLAVFTGLSIVGVLLGTQASKKVPSSQLKRAFGFMVAGVALLMVAKEILFQ